MSVLINLILVLAAAAVCEGRPSPKGGIGKVTKVAAESFYIFGYGSLLSRASVEKTNCGLDGVYEGEVDSIFKMLKV